MTLSVSSDTLFCYVRDTLKITYKDASLSSGKVGFHGYNSTIDNISGGELSGSVVTDNSNGLAILWQKISAAASSFSKFVVRTYSSYTPTKKFIDHISINDSTGQVILNDTIFGGDTRGWKPIFIRNNSLKIAGKKSRIASFGSDSILDTCSVEQFGDAVIFHKKIIWSDTVGGGSFTIVPNTDIGTDKMYVQITGNGTGYNPARGAFALIYGVDAPAPNAGNLYLGSATGFQAWYESKWHNFTYHDSTKIWIDLTSGVGGTAPYYSINAYDKGLGLNCSGTAAFRIIGDTTSIFGTIAKIFSELRIVQPNSQNGYAVIDSFGYRAYNTAQAWDDVGNINITNIKGSGTAGEAAWTNTGLGYSLNRFNTTDSMQGITEVFHSCVQGDSNEYHFHYETGSNDAYLTFISWSAHFICKNRGDSSTYNFIGTCEDTVPSGTKIGTERMVSFGKQYVPNLNIGATIIGVVKRISAEGGVAPSASPYGKLLGVHHRKNDLGSRGLYTK
jgi:hypothetical protein